MISALSLLGVSGLVAFGVMLKELIFAPEGFQDSEGFHLGRSLRSVPKPAPAVAGAASAVARAKVDPPVFKSAPTHSPLKILVVDDRPDVCLLLSAYLEQDLHTVVAAEDGREALEKFRRDRFDLVITDRVMPNMNGDQLATAIHEIEPSEPIILMTGYAEPKPLPANINLLIQKPFSRHEIREAIDTVLAA